MTTSALRTKISLCKFAPAARVTGGRGVLLALGGALLGVINGLFGAGGGMVAVPLLTYVAGLSEKKAHATAIALILPLCAVSAAVYAVRGEFDYAIMAPAVIGILLGGVLGAVALKKLAVPVINFLFYGLMLFAGLKMML